MNPSTRMRDRIADRRAFDQLLGDVRTRVDERLASWLRPKVASALQVSEEVGLAAEAIERLALRGGKRLRAALVAAGYEAAGGGTDLGLCVPGFLAIELLQVYLLIHDDWMDDDDVRRGGPAVHVALRDRFGSKELGDAGAVLAGDLASAYAQEALLESTLAPERVLRAARAFARIQDDVVVGQLAEFRGTRGLIEGIVRPGPTVETIHALKTASYTVTGPLVLGAMLAGGDDARAAELTRFGRPLGVAFQLRDDLLGVFGDPSATGKPIWNDIRQGKQTALVAELRRDPGAEALLAGVLGRVDAPAADVERVVRAMEGSGAKARVEARVRELSAEAEDALAAAKDVSENARAWLSGAVSALGERSA